MRALGEFATPFRREFEIHVAMRQAGLNPYGQTPEGLKGPWKKLSPPRS